jgi:hypothetical protein
MSANNETNVDAEGWVQTKSKKSWSIDRKQKSDQRKPRTSGNRTFERTDRTDRKPLKKVVKEKIPDVVADMLVTEFLTLVGDSDWNDPVNVSKTISNMMSIDLSQPIDGQVPRPVEIDRTVFVPANKGSDIPYWICQSLIRVDEKFGNRFINYKGAKYNKIDIIFECVRFKERMDQVARAAHCSWNARWGNAKKEENRLYQKTRTGAQSDESWLDRCVKHLLTDADTDGINIKNLCMIEFKRDLGLLKNPEKWALAVDQDQMTKFIEATEEFKKRIDNGETDFTVNFPKITVPYGVSVPDPKEPVADPKEPELDEGSQHEEQDSEEE